MIYNKDCSSLKEIENNSIDALITDPPYGINYKNNTWDKKLPNKEIWENSLDKLKPGAFGAVFSSIRLMHRLMCDLEDSGFLIKDVLFWVFLNGMPKSKNVALDIDKHLGIESNIIGTYKYEQGYRSDKEKEYNLNYKRVADKKKPVSELGKKYEGANLSLKPSYEPIILIQKPIDRKISIAQNVIKYGTGLLNIEHTRIPFSIGEKKIGHNPNPNGRVASNIWRTDEFNDGYDKFFTIPKVRGKKDVFNNHPTIKPIELMNNLVKLVSFEGQTVIDPFMGSGSTGVSAKNLGRKFIGYEINEKYFEIATKRLKNVQK